MNFFPIPTNPWTLLGLLQVALSSVSFALVLAKPLAGHVADGSQAYKGLLCFNIAASLAAFLIALPLAPPLPLVPFLSCSMFIASTNSEP